MSSNSEQNIRSALQGVLDLYGVKLDDLSLRDGQESPSQSEYAHIIGKTQAKLDELNEKAEEIYKRTGMSREQLEAYIDNPHNFSAEQWEALQKVKDACNQYKKEALSRLQDPDFEEKVTGQKKQKQLRRFAKKKNWIPL